MRLCISVFLSGTASENIQREGRLRAPVPLDDGVIDRGDARAEDAGVVAPELRADQGDIRIAVAETE